MIMKKNILKGKKSKKYFFFKVDSIDQARNSKVGREAENKACFNILYKQEIQ